ncbi:MAG: 50S ribosomal protein L22 [Patescibacteria group bacterium]|jgi:large subunit ribosomal protein L22
MRLEVKARYIKKAPRKVRLICDLVRGKDVNQALVQLTFLKKEAAVPVKKLVESAIANAVNNFNLDKDNLYIASIFVDGGPVLKRWMPRAHGRATELKKKMSHIVLVLAERVPSKTNDGKKVKKSKEKIEIVNNKPKDETVISKTDGKVNAKKSEEEVSEEIFDPRMKGKHRHNQNQDKKQMKEAGNKSFIKKVFNRKSGS